METSTYLPVLVAVGLMVVFVALLLAQRLGGWELRVPGAVRWVLLGGVVLCSVYTLFKQYPYFREEHPKIVVFEAALLLGCALLPAGAMLLGDWAGASNYLGHTTVSFGDFMLCVAIGAAVGLVASATANALLIVSGFRSVVDTVCELGYWALWLAVLFVSFVVYNFEYTAHEPGHE